MQIKNFENKCKNLFTFEIFVNYPQGNVDNVDNCK